MTKRMTGARSAAPPSGELDGLLGRSRGAWDQLHAALAAGHGPLAEKWSFSGRTQRWSLQLKEARKKRTILYMIPCPGHFLAAFALGEKACRAAAESGLPAAWLAAIENAPRYAEGRGLWLEIRNRKDAQNVMRLAAVKLAN